ncbi:MAG TPA: diguanylate cyclase [Solirubrobacteraceae bacterium]|nr:diguanylate cyclase [Solirubrobacteraceae bacterium]
MLQSPPSETEAVTGDRYRTAFEHAVLPAWFCDPELHLTDVNAAFCEMLGRPREQLVGRRLSEFIHLSERDEDERELHSLLSGERDAVAREKRMLRPDSAMLWALVVMSAAHDADGHTSYLVGQATDLTERHRRETRLRHQADHDPLTGLVNRRGFGRELRRHISRVQRYGATGALLMIDLDNFKIYNDTNGHAGGDALLQTVAIALTARLRAGDVVGRIGGDEFAVLVPAATAEQAEVVGAALVESVRELGQDNNPPVTASVGIFCFDEQIELSEHHAMVGADIAMYAAKNAGRDRYAPSALWTSAAASRTMSGHSQD